MGHWRDGGIGNMAGSDDRPFDEWTLLEKLSALSGHSAWPLPIQISEGGPIAQEAFDFIEPMTAAVRRGEPIPMPWAWRPIDTAPVPAYKPNAYNNAFSCLLQDENGSVYAGEGYWALSRSKTPLLRWRGGAYLRQRSPKYWMPLPAPKMEKD